MYPAKINSPSSTLVNAITDSQTTIELVDVSVLPDDPNLLTIGDGEDAETCLYTNITGSVVTVQRGFEGVAKAWDAGAPVARNFTAYDHNTFKSQIEGIPAPITPAGSNTEMQYNNNGVFGASPEVTFQNEGIRSKTLQMQEFRTDPITSFALAQALRNRNVLPVILGAYTDLIYFKEVFKTERWDVPTQAWVDEPTFVNLAKNMVDGSNSTSLTINNTWQKIRISIRVETLLNDVLFFVAFYNVGSNHCVPSFDTTMEFSTTDDFASIVRTWTAPRMISPSNFASLAWDAIPNSINLIDMDSNLSTSNSNVVRITLDFTVPENDHNPTWSGRQIRLSQMGMFSTILSKGIPQRVPYTWNRSAITTLTSLNVVGALSKSSGSFKIDHPLPEKKESHHLVHSFVESPKADLIYSGMAKLTDGKVTINIDEESGMTEGTFEALCRENRRFCTNEEGFTRVKSILDGNLLTIIAEDNTCTDEIFWQVIAERKDDHMFNTSWTDENGRVIVEPEKEVFDEQ